MVMARFVEQCEKGKGAILLAVYRGKISEGKRFIHKNNYKYCLMKG